MDKIVMIPTAMLLLFLAGGLLFFYGVEYLFNRSDFKELEDLEKKLY